MNNRTIVSCLDLLLCFWLTCLGGRSARGAFVNSFSCPMANSNRQLRSTAILESKRSSDSQHCFQDPTTIFPSTTRRDWLSLSSFAFLSTAATPQPTHAAAAAVQDSLDIDSFLRTGVDAGGNMGVSSQAGKSRPQTGVVFRDGSDVNQDPRSGAVAAELLTGTKDNPKAILISFVSPWKLETGPVFDVETRDSRTGDGAFVAVTRSVEGKGLDALPDAFFLERLFDKTGRFSFYGPPTDIKVKKSYNEKNARFLEVSFSNLSQSTNAELPRRALVKATLPANSDNAVMLVTSTSAPRWKTEKDKLRAVVESFQAVPAPKSSLKLRAKQRGAPALEF